MFGGGGANLIDSGPWCEPLVFGDADILFGEGPAGFALNNNGDTLTFTATTSNASAVLTSMTYGNGAATGQSLVRNPADLSVFVPYSTALEALADRDFSPGTPIDGTTFAQAP